MRDGTVGFRVTPREREIIESTAEGWGVPVASFLRFVALQACDPPPEPSRASEGALTGAQAVVWSLVSRPGGACRRDLALVDVWELSNRISEIEDRLGIEIRRGRCVVHQHRHRVVRYSVLETH